MINRIRGFRDILPPLSDGFTSLENLARKIFRLYFYRELRLPTVEMRELFVKSTGETTDIVQK
ncbi:MAG: histidine--tRNA ligase, partial [bacterium]